jgi:glutathione S-transferase
MAHSRPDGILDAMIELHTMAPAWGLPTFTPFGLKLIAYMRLCEIPFRIVVEHNPARGPKGKFPWIVDAGTTVGDSGFVVQYLAEVHGARLDAWHSAPERALAHALRRMVEESLCFSILYFRWTDDTTYLAATDVALRAMPPLLRLLARPLIRKRILRDLWGQGVGRHQHADVLRLGQDDLDALAGVLGEREYLLGDRPSAVDASAAAFLSVLMRPPLELELADHARSHANLVAYEGRMAGRCFA